MIGALRLSQSNQLYAIRRPNTITLAQALSEMTAQIFELRGTGPKFHFALSALHFKSEYRDVDGSNENHQALQPKPEAVIGADGKSPRTACRR